MSCIHYKFKSSLEYQTVTFDGLHISVGDLKKEIAAQKRMRPGDFELEISNAQTGEVYKNNNTLIPKNASVVVYRVPVKTCSASSTQKSWEAYKQEVAKAREQERQMSLEQLKQTPNLANAAASEIDKVIAAVHQSNKGFEPSNYVGKHQSGPVPDAYVCRKCGQTGHYVSNCPNRGQEELEPRFKRTTGIPASFLTYVDDPLTPGALLTHRGQFAVPTIDIQAYREGKKERPPFINQQGKSEPEKPPIPCELKCQLCQDLMTDAVVIPCCGNSYCDECIRDALLETEDHQCPTCHTVGVSPNGIISNNSLRSAVQAFTNDSGYSKARRLSSDNSYQPNQPSSKQQRSAPHQQSLSQQRSAPHPQSVSQQSGQHHGPPQHHRLPTQAPADVNHVPQGQAHQIQTLGCTSGGGQPPTPPVVQPSTPPIVQTSAPPPVASIHLNQQSIRAPIAHAPPVYVSSTLTTTGSSGLVPSMTLNNLELIASYSPQNTSSPRDMLSMYEDDGMEQGIPVLGSNISRGRGIRGNGRGTRGSLTQQLENAQYLAVQTTAMTVPPGTTSHIPYANPPPGFPPIALPPPGYAYPPPVHPGYTTHMYPVYPGVPSVSHHGLPPQQDDVNKLHLQTQKKRDIFEDFAKDLIENRRERPRQSRSRSRSRSYTPRPVRSRTQSHSRSRSRSFKSRSRSPYRKRSLSPRRPRSRTASRSRSFSRGRSRSTSPRRSRPRSISPGRGRSRSFGREKSRSPGREKSRTPETGRYRSPGRGRSRSLSKSRYRSPGKRRSRSPEGSRYRSPGRGTPRSPSRKSRSPSRRRSPWSRSPRSHSRNRVRSLTPVRRRRTRSRSLSRSKRSPSHRRTLSRSRSHSWSSPHRHSQSLSPQRIKFPLQPAPFVRRSVSPYHHQALSPGFRNDVPPLQHGFGTVRGRGRGRGRARRGDWVPQQYRQFNSDPSHRYQYQYHQGIPPEEFYRQNAQYDQYYRDYYAKYGSNAPPPPPPPAHWTGPNQIFPDGRGGHILPNPRHVPPGWHQQPHFQQQPQQPPTAAQRLLPVQRMSPQQQFVPVGRPNTVDQRRSATPQPPGVDKPEEQIIRPDERRDFHREPVKEHPEASGRGYPREPTRDYAHELARDYHTELPRDSRRDYPRDQHPREIRRDYTREYPKDSGREYSREQGRDNYRDNGRDYPRDHGRDYPKEHTRDYKEFDKSDRDRGSEDRKKKLSEKHNKEKERERKERKIDDKENSDSERKVPGAAKKKSTVKRSSSAADKVVVDKKAKKGIEDKTKAAGDKSAVVKKKATSTTKVKKKKKVVGTGEKKNSDSSDIPVSKNLIQIQIREGSEESKTSKSLEQANQTVKKENDTKEPRSTKSISVTKKSIKKIKKLKTAELKPDSSSENEKTAKVVNQKNLNMPETQIKKISKDRLEDSSQIAPENFSTATENEQKMEPEIKVEPSEPSIAGDVREVVPMESEGMTEVSAEDGIERKVVESGTDEKQNELMLHPPEISKWERDDYDLEYSDAQHIRKKTIQMEKKSFLPRSVLKRAEKYISQKPVRPTVGTATTMASLNKIQRRVYVENEDSHHRLSEKEQRKVKTARSSSLDMQITISKGDKLSPDQEERSTRLDHKNHHEDHRRTIRHEDVHRTIVKTRDNEPELSERRQHSSGDSRRTYHDQSRKESISPKRESKERERHHKDETHSSSLSHQDEHQLSKKSSLSEKEAAMRDLRHKLDQARSKDRQSHRTFDRKESVIDEAKFEPDYEELEEGSSEESGTAGEQHSTVSTEGTSDMEASPSKRARRDSEEETSEKKSKHKKTKHKKHKHKHKKRKHKKHKNKESKEI